MSREEELTATAPDLAPATRQPKPEIVLGRYRIEHQLGAGGMGVVYAAFDLDLQRSVALKVIREGMSREAEQRFLREAQAMAKLQHVNVVTIYDVETANGRDYISMELVDGESLVDWLRVARRSEAEVIDAFLQAGRGLAAAHAKGIVHRDFKPHNVLRSKDGRIAVTDFGLARVARGPNSISVPPEGGAPDLSGLTVPGTRLGTPAYMSPEQWAGGRVTLASDQFSYCVALWEALAGERPFRGDTPEALRAKAERGAEGLDASKIPRRLRPVLLRGLATDPTKRWPSMAVLLAELAPRRRWPWIAAAVVAIAIAAVAVVALRGEDSSDKWRALQREALVARYDGELDTAADRYRRMLELDIEQEATAIELGKVLLARKQPGDLVEARQIFARSTSTEMEWLDATAAWLMGEQAAPNRLLQHHAKHVQGRLTWQGPATTGTVVLPDGKPANGATVAVGVFVFGDANTIALPSWDVMGIAASVWITEAFGGRFHVRLTPPREGIVVAQLGALRSRGAAIVDNQEIKLEPTFTIRGRVELGGRTDSLSASAHLVGSRVFVSARVERDGRFVISGLVRGPTIVSISSSASESPVSGFGVQRRVDIGVDSDELVFELPATRTLGVIVRGMTGADFEIRRETGGPVALVYVASGQFDDSGKPATNLEERAQLASEPAGIPAVTISAADQPFDAYARFRRAPIGEATVCVQVVKRQADNRITRCRPVPPNAELVVVEL